mmetsp:Transcript_21913/g.60832  ORF Transcript_21913/g.60832 Transcript_21913/m.60832 type:complete len:1381 (-) Transcript_21913:229-4371(-)|eukprot:CAMPEP_0117672296 /NCGR_PEP_ID=MMETSP0804-20121206/13820_1 /TAXON_ID=1074897 /ORGANISM="Tetraselmis astigmatica, Strain CCMP880" /LENGTH=1380 /DNA_ID=CAMNT_0005480871 /DNA_START=93 /DNA_END=4235 /DNA_ORIENTATION=-
MENVDDSGRRAVVLEDGTYFQINPNGFSSEEAFNLLQVWGKNELNMHRTPRWSLFWRHLCLPMPILIWGAIIFEACIGDWANAAVLCLLQLCNAAVSWREETKSCDAVSALRSTMTHTATVKRDGQWGVIDSSFLVPGDLVLLHARSSVPADCVLHSSQLEVDESLFTGELLPVTKGVGCSVKMGSSVNSGEAEATVQATGKYTRMGQTAAMLQSVPNSDRLQRVLLPIVLALAGFAVLLCSICLTYLLTVQGVTLTEAVQFSVVLLIASVPIALEVVTTSTLALGSRQLTKRQAVVTQLNAIEAVAGMTVLCSDVTGTLSESKLVVQSQGSLFIQPGLDQYTLLRFAAMATKWNEPPKDPVDTMVLTSADLESLRGVELLHHVPFDSSSRRTESTVIESGSQAKVSKGAPDVMLALLQDSHRVRIQPKIEKQVEDLALKGRCTIAICRSCGDHWEFLGLLAFQDPLRCDAKDTVSRAKEYGVKVKLLTGENQQFAKEVAAQLGLGNSIVSAASLPALNTRQNIPQDLVQKHGRKILRADGFACANAEHKYLIVEALRQCGHTTGMMGDGVGDAPALRRADVGFAVLGAADAAKAASDVTLTGSGLGVVIDAVVIARCVFRRMKSFLIYRIASTLEISCFFLISVLFLHPSDYNPYWPTYFSLPVGMLILITVLNDWMIITIAYDRVQPSRQPEKWRMPELFAAAICLGAVACGSSLLLLYLALGTAVPDSFFVSYLGLQPLDYGEIVALLFLKISVSNFLTVFSARHTGWLWSSKPHWLLASSAVLSAALSVLLASFWPSSLDPPVQGLATGGGVLWIPVSLAYSVLFWLVQDALKVAVYKMMYSTRSAEIGVPVRHLSDLSQGRPLPRSKRRWLKPTVAISLFWVTFTVYASISAIFPLIADAMDNDDLSGSAGSIILSVYPFSVMFAMPAVGVLIARFGRPMMGLLGIIVLGAATAPLGSAYHLAEGNETATVLLYICLRAMAGFGGSLAEVSVYSMAMDLFHADVGKLSGANEVILGAGFLLGPTVGLALTSAFGTELGFFVLSFCILACLPLLAVAVVFEKAVIVLSSQGTSQEKIKDIEGVSSPAQDKLATVNELPLNSSWSLLSVLRRWRRIFNVRVALAYLLHMLGTMGSIMVLTFLPGHLANYRLSAAQIGLVCGVSAVTYTIAGIPCGWLNDRWDPHLLNNIGTIAGGACLCVLGIQLGTSSLHSTGDVNFTKDVIALACYGVAMTGIFVPILAVLKRSCPKKDPEATEAVVALYTLTESLAMGAAPLIGVALVQLMGFESTMATMGYCHLAFGSACQLYDIWHPPPGGMSIPGQSAKDQIPDSMPAHCGKQPVKKSDSQMQSPLTPDSRRRQPQPYELGVALPPIVPVR